MKMYSLFRANCTTQAFPLKIILKTARSAAYSFNIIKL